MKRFLTVMILGSILTSTTIVSAGSNQVTVNDASYVRFMFNGIEKSVPEGYTVLMYQDRTYVPARFVAENLGANVGWDGNTQTVIIDSPPKENSIQKISLFVNSIKTQLSNYGINVQRADIVVDDKGGFIEYNYSPSTLTQEQLFRNYSIMASLSNAFDYPLDGAIINMYSQTGILTSTTWISSVNTKEFIDGKLSTNDYVKSWLIKGYTNTNNLQPGNLNLSNCDAIKSSIIAKYEALKRQTEEYYGSIGMARSSALKDELNKLNQQEQTELAQVPCN